MYFDETDNSSKSFFQYQFYDNLWIWWGISYSSEFWTLLVEIGSVKKIMLVGKIQNADRVDCQ